MASNPPVRPLRDALTGGDSDDPVDWITGLVVAVQLSIAPHTITVRLADGTEVPGITFLGWWVPRVNDVVHLLRRGPAMLALGAVSPTQAKVSPHRHRTADIDGYVTPADPTPAAPPPKPSAPPTVRTVGVTPVGKAYWSPYGWKSDDLAQGGPQGLRAFVWYDTRIADAKGSGTITGGSVYFQRRNTSHGPGGGANVRLGTHGFTLQNVTNPTLALGSVEVTRTLARGEAANVPLSAAQIAALNAGARGIGLEPGAGSYSSPDYLRMVNDAAAGQLSLTIQG